MKNNRKTAEMPFQQIEKIQDPNARIDAWITALRQAAANLGIKEVF